MQREKRMKKKKKPNQYYTQELWNNYKRYNILVMEIPEGEEIDKGAQEIFEVITAKNFPKLMTDTKAQIGNRREH